MLQVKNLSLRTAEQVLCEDLNFTLHEAEITILAGESGSGKSITGRALAGISASNLKREGEIIFRGRSYSDAEISRELTGREIALISQNPASGLNPQIKTGKQIGELLRVKEGCGRKETKKRVLELMEELSIVPAETYYNAYPHSLSGGMAQRAMIASMIISDPALLIADEPTTAVDIINQIDIINLFKAMRDKGRSILFITHSLELAGNFADKIIVMRHGKIIEQGPAAEILASPGHAYTKALLDAVPRI